MQVVARDCELALDGARRHAVQFCDLFRRQTAKDAQGERLRQILVLLFQCTQSLIDCQRLRGVELGVDCAFLVELRPHQVATAFLRQTLARAIDDGVAHSPRGEIEKVFAVIERDEHTARQLQECFVDQCCRRQRRTAIVAAELTRGEPAQFGVDLGKGSFCGRGIAIPGSVQPFCQRLQ